MSTKRQQSRRGIDRRTFFKAAGLGAGAFMLPSLAPRTAAAGGGSSRPPRVIFMLTELGWNPFAFRMAPPGAPEEVLLRSAYHPAYNNQPDPLSWELDLRTTPRDRWSEILAPLYDIRDEVIALDGLGMLSIGTDNLGDGHAVGWNHALTGHPAGSFITGQRAMAGRRSIDMEIAHHLRARYPHLSDLAVLHMLVGYPGWGGGGTDTFHHWFYDETPDGSIFKVHREGEVRRLHDRVFGAGLPGDDADALSRAQGAMLDALGDRYAAVSSRLSGGDRNRLELHRQLISDARQRMRVLEEMVCEVPDAPMTRGEWWNSPLSGGEAHRANIEAFFNLAAIALSCDLSRVICMEFANQGPYLGDLFGAQDADFHERYSHGTNPPARWFGVEGSRATQAQYDWWLEAYPVLTRKNRFHTSQAAQLAQLLQSIPDGEGTLLDNTLIVLMDEISHGSHGHDQWPVVLIGGNAFRKGRYIRFPRTNPSPGRMFSASGAYSGVPHNHLLVSILQHFGIETDTMGVDSVQARAPGQASRTISLTGPLHELT